MVECSLREGVLFECLEGSRFRVQGSGFMVQGSGFRMQSFGWWAHHVVAASKAGLEDFVASLLSKRSIFAKHFCLRKEDLVSKAFETKYSSSLLFLSLELSDTTMYAPSIRALLGTASHFC